MNKLSAELKDKLTQKGASIIGFADISDLPFADRDGYPHGVVIGVALLPSLVIRTKNGPSIEYRDETNRITEFLDNLAEYAAQVIKSKGFSALPKTRKVVVTDQQTKRTKLPHKTIATKAGIGWIGKGALLITEEYGAAIRITSVLTNADLDFGAPVTTSRCGDCTECQKICPANAVVGKNWVAGMDRGEIFRALDCRNKIIERGRELGMTELTCGLCILACPWTQKYLKRKLNNEN